jgi:hypothetical protein
MRKTTILFGAACGQTNQMWVFRYALLLIVPILLIGACAKYEEPLLDALTADQITGELLWERISADTDYSKYAYWPGHEGVKPGQAPHGAFHRVYVNRVLLEMMPVREKIAPIGTVIVKDNLDASKTRVSITAMAKIQGYDPENGDWFWANYTSEGEVKAAGKLKGCIGCHEGLKENDYVIVQMLDAPLRN